ncbi:glycosyltransferase family 2 protein [Tsuneonella amylolytica]|uniref:glycosyltransferase family 2 protein n=1 Tax=Tsuneonella amylolytica TaxID=2338327 RepID=UPI000EAAA7F8|nr:glycosyltransferase family 2 protein [Tsuneonella amylolytica]
MKLSICIATFNRAGFIGETLEALARQLRPGVEIVVVDGASPDDTEGAVRPFLDPAQPIRYYRETENSGVDGDYDKAVGYARGDHVWLFPDDDLPAPGAIDRVLEVLADDDPDLLVVDSEVRDLSVTRTLRESRLPFAGTRAYGPQDADRLLADTGYNLTFIGGVVVRKALWEARQREPYYGSLFIHAGVIFQTPGIARAKVLAEPLIRIRAGNSMWQARSFEIWAFKWPDLVWGFGGYSNRAKKAVVPREPWRSIAWLVGYRALGAYSRAEYDRFLAKRLNGPARLMAKTVAALPGKLVNFAAVVGLALVGKGGSAVAYDLVASSRYSNAASRLVTRLWLGRHNPKAR